MGSASGYKICSVDGSKLFRSESKKFDYSFSLFQKYIIITHSYRSVAVNTEIMYAF